MQKIEQTYSKYNNSIFSNKKTQFKMSHSTKDWMLKRHMKICSTLYSSRKYKLTKDINVLPVGPWSAAMSELSWKEDLNLPRLYISALLCLPHPCMLLPWCHLPCCDIATRPHNRANQKSCHTPGFLELQAKSIYQPPSLWCYFTATGNRLTQSLVDFLSVPEN